MGKTVWAKELGCQMINFTPGSGSHRDFAPEGHAAFLPTTELLRDVLDYETNAKTGLNGHLLLFHLGTERQDKVYTRLGSLIDELRARAYRFVRIDELIEGGNRAL